MPQKENKENEECIKDGTVYKKDFFQLVITGNWNNWSWFLESDIAAEFLKYIFFWSF